MEEQVSHCLALGLTAVSGFSAQSQTFFTGHLDSLTMSSTITIILPRSLGHASWNRKVSKKHRVTEDPVRMPPIVDFTTETAKDREWDNIAAIHRFLVLLLLYLLKSAFS